MVLWALVPIPEYRSNVLPTRLFGCLKRCPQRPCFGCAPHPRMSVEFPSDLLVWFLQQVSSMCSFGPWSSCQTISKTFECSLNSLRILYFRLIVTRGALNVLVLVVHPIPECPSNVLPTRFGGYVREKRLLERSRRQYQESFYLANSR